MFMKRRISPQASSNPPVTKMDSMLYNSFIVILFFQGRKEAGSREQGTRNKGQGTGRQASQEDGVRGRV
jgi:hypothetical protein